MRMREEVSSPPPLIPLKADLTPPASCPDISDLQRLNTSRLATPAMLISDALCVERVAS